MSRRERPALSAEEIAEEARSPKRQTAEDFSPSVAASFDETSFMKNVEKEVGSADWLEKLSNVATGDVAPTTIAEVPAVPADTPSGSLAAQMLATTSNLAPSDLSSLICESTPTSGLTADRLGVIMLSLVTNILINEKLDNVYVLFDHMDTDADGNLDANELQQGFAKLGAEITRTEATMLLALLGSQHGISALTFSKMVYSFNEILQTRWRSCVLLPVLRANPSAFRHVCSTAVAPLTAGAFRVMKRFMIAILVLNHPISYVFSSLVGVDESHALAEVLKQSDFLVCVERILHGFDGVTLSPAQLEQQRADIALLFSHYDCKRTNTLDFAQFAASVVDMNEIMQRQVLKTIGSRETRSRYLEESLLRAMALSRSTIDLVELWQTFDKDCDGVLNEKEYVALLVFLGLHAGVDDVQLSPAFATTQTAPSYPVGMEVDYFVTMLSQLRGRLLKESADLIDLTPRFLQQFPNVPKGSEFVPYVSFDRLAIELRHKCFLLLRALSAKNVSCPFLFVRLATGVLPSGLDDPIGRYLSEIDIMNMFVAFAGTTSQLLTPVEAHAIVATFGESLSTLQVANSRASGLRLQHFLNFVKCCSEALSDCLDACVRSVDDRRKVLAERIWCILQAGTTKYDKDTIPLRSFTAAGSDKLIPVPFLDVWKLFAHSDPQMKSEFVSSSSFAAGLQKLGAGSLSPSEIRRIFMAHDRNRDGCVRVSSFVLQSSLLLSLLESRCSLRF